MQLPLIASLKFLECFPVARTLPVLVRRSIPRREYRRPRRAGVPRPLGFHLPLKGTPEHPY